MQIVAKEKLNNYPNKNIWFVRVQPSDLSATIADILTILADNSWLAKLDEEMLRMSFASRANKTYQDLVVKFNNTTCPTFKSTTGEYIVSVLAQQALEREFTHSRVPLMELIGVQRSQNPGFDFYTECSQNLLHCGEAKYITGANAYGSSLGQIDEFLNDNKHIDDFATISPFVSQQSATRLLNGEIGLAAAFSTTGIQTDRIIANIERNADFQKLVNTHNDIILLGVNIA